MLEKSRIVYRLFAYLSSCARWEEGFYLCCCWVALVVPCSSVGRTFGKMTWRQRSRTVELILAERCVMRMLFGTGWLWLVFHPWTSWEAEQVSSVVGLRWRFACLRLASRTQPQPAWLKEVYRRSPVWSWTSDLWLFWTARQIQALCSSLCFVR